MEDNGGNVRLRFPDGYDQKVGQFCRKLNVGVDKLPALILVNGETQKDGLIPYWSLKGNDLKESSDALISLVGDMQRANIGAYPVGNEKDKTAWLSRATNELLNSASGRQVRTLILENTGATLGIVKILLSIFKTSTV